jgi:hypothetical protein
MTELPSISVILSPPPQPWRSEVAERTKRREIGKAKVLLRIENSVFIFVVACGQSIEYPI